MNPIGARLLDIQSCKISPRKTNRLREAAWRCWPGADARFKRLMPQPGNGAAHVTCVNTVVNRQDGRRWRRSGRDCSASQTQETARLLHSMNSTPEASTMAVGRKAVSRRLDLPDSGDEHLPVDRLAGVPLMQPQRQGFGEPHPQVSARCIQGYR